MTAPGPLARKLAEAEAERDRLAALVLELPYVRDQRDRQREALIEVTAERDALRSDVEVLRDEARAAYNRALYFARALREHHDTHHHPDGTGCDPEKWATCRAVQWLREMGQG